MKGKSELKKAVRAGYSFFYARTYEPMRTVATIKETADELEYKFIAWDLEREENGEVEPRDPEEVIELLQTAEARTVLLAKNLNWFLKDNLSLVNYLQNRAERFTKQAERKVLVIVGDADFNEAIPESLRADFLSIDFPLPNEEEISLILEEIIETVKENEKFVMPSDKEKKQIILSSRGLSKREIENAFAYTLIKNEGKLNPKTVAEIQAKEVEATAGLRIFDSDEEVIEPLGNDRAKRLILPSVSNPNARGVMLLGPAGTGKTHIARWIGSQSGMKVIEMEPSQMMGEGLVGQAQNAWNRAIEVIKANAPCILFIDEIEKGLSGASNRSGAGQSYMKQTASSFLKFLSSEKEREGIYVIATCNDISSLDPEWIRAERWDAIFYMDFPNKKAKKAIFELYAERFAINGIVSKEFNKEFDTITKGWSGAELKTLCRLSSLMQAETIEEILPYIVPISVTAEEVIRELEKWKKRVVLAEDVFIPRMENGKKSARRVEL